MQMIDESLQEAAMNLSKDDIKKSLNKGADVNERDKDGNTPIHLVLLSAKTLRDHAAVTSAIKLLLNRGANPNLRNDDGETPLFLVNRLIDQHCKNQEGYYHNTQVLLRNRGASLEPEINLILKIQALSDRVKDLEQQSTEQHNKLPNGTHVTHTFYKR